MKIFRISKLLIPLSVQRVKVNYPGILQSWSGFLVIRIFGVRIAEIQIENPW